MRINEIQFDDYRPGAPMDLSTQSDPSFSSDEEEAGASVEEPAGRLHDALPQGRHRLLRSCTATCAPIIFFHARRCGPVAVCS